MASESNGSPKRTTDGRFLVVGGRRWRASDPTIPEALRVQLVAELMAARRAVREDPSAARPRVHDAKVALGERGRPWWEPPTIASFRHRATSTTRTLLRHRDPDSSICPSDVARTIGGASWRSVLDDVRSALATLADVGVVVATQRKEPIDLRTARGPVRIRRGPHFPSDGSRERR